MPDLQADEICSPLIPDVLAGGHWWRRARVGAWPAALRRGVIEPRRGYRFRPENMTLPMATGAWSAERVVDLGAGSGSLMVLAAIWTGATHAVGVELQPDAAARLTRTLSAYPEFEGRVVEGDLRRPECLDAVRGALGGDADLVVMNPPFFPRGWGRPSRNTSTRLSTHAEHGDVGDFLTAARLLAPQGRILAVYDAARMAEFVARAGACRLGLTGVWWIPDQRPGKEEQPFRLWLELGRGGARIAPIDTRGSSDLCDTPQKG